jgi:hypothetical protein
MQTQYSALQEFTDQLKCAFARKCEALDAVTRQLEALELQLPGSSRHSAHGDAMCRADSIHSSIYGSNIPSMDSLNICEDDDAMQGHCLRPDLKMLLETDNTASDTISESAYSIGHTSTSASSTTPPTKLAEERSPLTNEIKTMEVRAMKCLLEQSDALLEKQATKEKKLQRAYVQKQKELAVKDFQIEALERVIERLSRSTLISSSAARALP